MAITYEFHRAANWLSDRNARAIRELLDWRLSLLKERLDVKTDIALCQDTNVKAMRKEKMRVGGSAPALTKCIISFDAERIDPDDESWREEFFTSVDHEIFHGAQFWAAHRSNNFSFDSDLILEGGATSFEIEMGSSIRPQLTVLRTDEDFNQAACFAEQYWRKKLPYDRDGWLFGKPQNVDGKRLVKAKTALHRARTGYSFSFAVFSGYCNTVEKLPSDLLYVTASDVMNAWLNGQLRLAPEGPDRAMISQLSKERGYTRLP